MPKIVIYLRADDARAIERAEGKKAAEWLRPVVKSIVERKVATLDERTQS